MKKLRSKNHPDVMQPDSRLLANLIAQEKEHAKQLAALFPVVNAALASLSAYATASGPPAQSVATVVHAFAAADDALHHRYAHAVDTWRTQLVALKDLEDDFAAVLRKRDILVTRLLKVSKSTRDAHRSSFIGISASLTTHPSSNDKTAAVAPFALTPVPAPGNTNTKLAQAQAELQACEAHLVSKERELDLRRIAVMHDGLGERCRALIDCAAVWAEMGKQGLRALQALSQNRNQSHSDSQYHRDLGENLSAFSRSLPTPTSTHLSTHSAHPSDSSSHIATCSTEVSHESPPSFKKDANPPQASKPRFEIKTQLESEVQLAQKSNPSADTDAGTIALPPAHAIPELTVPTDVHSRSPPSDGHSMLAAATQQPAMSKTTSISSPAPLRRRTSNRLSDDVSDETSDGPSLAPHHPRHSRSTIDATTDATITSANTTLPPLTPQSLSLQAFSTRGTSNFEEFNDEYGDPSDSHPDSGPFQIAENNPFEVIRWSTVISPAASIVAPNTATDEPLPPNALVSLNTSRARTGLIFPTSAPAHASAPGVRTSVGDPIAGSASKSVLGPVSGLTPTLAPAKRERQTSVFFNSLRGLFRKPNKPEGEQQQQRRGRGAVIEWDDSDERGSPESSGHASTVARAEANWRRGAGGGRGGGWITRTDGKHAYEGSDTTSVTNTATSPTGLPPIRRGQGQRNGSSSGSGVGSGNGPMLSISVHVSKTVRVDGWVTDDPVGVGAGSKVMNMTPRMGTGALMQTSTGATGLGQSRTARRSTTKRRKTSVADLRGSDQGQSDGEVMVGNGDEAEQLWEHEEIGTNADLGRLDNAKTKRRRSASLSEADGYLAMLSSSPTPLQTPAPSRLPSRTPSSASSSSPTPHAHKQHVKNQNLLSIVADVTGQRQHSHQDGDISFDAPRGPVSSVLSREGADRDRSPVGEVKVMGVERRLWMDTAIATTTMMDGRGHAGSASSPESGRSDAERGHGRGEGLASMPLRSALRNVGRTPSPGPVSLVTPVVWTTTTGTVVPLGGAAADERNRFGRSWRDSASVSSYVTGRESFDGEVQQSRVPSPPVEPPVVVGNGHANPNANSGSDTTAESVLPSLTVSTGTDATTTTAPAAPTVKARHKSVRVSLQPTFSPTPLALFDEDDDGERHASWSRTFSLEEEDWARRRHGGGRPEDVWADSRGWG